MCSCTPWKQCATCARREDSESLARVIAERDAAVAQRSASAPFAIGDVVRFKRSGKIKAWTGAATAPGARFADVDWPDGSWSTHHENELVRADASVQLGPVGALCSALLHVAVAAREVAATRYTETDLRFIRLRDALAALDRSGRRTEGAPAEPDTSKAPRESWWACTCGVAFNTTHPEGQWCADGHAPRRVSERIERADVVDIDGHNWRGRRRTEGAKECGGGSGAGSEDGTTTGTRPASHARSTASTSGVADAAGGNEKTPAAPNACTDDGCGEPLHKHTTRDLDRCFEKARSSPTPGVAPQPYSAVAPERVELWDAIHAYARASYTGKERGPSGDRMTAVSRITRAVEDGMFDLLQRERAAHSSCQADDVRLSEVTAAVSRWSADLRRALLGDVEAHEAAIVVEVLRLMHRATSNDPEVALAKDCRELIGEFRERAVARRDEEQSIQMTEAADDLQVILDSYGHRMAALKRSADSSKNRP